MKDVAIERADLQNPVKGAAEPVSSSQPALRGVTAPAIEAAAGLDTGWQSAASTRDSELRRSSSSAEYITSEIRRHKKSVAVMALLVVTVAAVGLGYYFHARNSRVAIDSIA